MTEMPAWQPQTQAQPQPQPQAAPEPAQQQVAAMPQQLQPAQPSGQDGGWQPQVQYEVLAGHAAQATPAPQQAPWPAAYASVPDVPSAAAFAQPGQPAPLPSHHAEGAGMHQLQPQPEFHNAAFPAQLQPQPQQMQTQAAGAPAAWATFNS